MTKEFPSSGDAGHYQVYLEAQGSNVTAKYGYGNALYRKDGEFPLFDGHGSERTVTNGSQTVTGTINFDAFGQTVGTSGSSSNPYMFAATSGYRSDGDAGLMHVRARYYDAQVGRFISRDTVLAEHPYLYCAGNPVNAVDPDGHIPVIVAWILILMAASVLAYISGLGLRQLSPSTSVRAASRLTEARPAHSLMSDRRSPALASRRVPFRHPVYTAREALGRESTRVLRSGRLAALSRQRSPQESRSVRPAWAVVGGFTRPTGRLLVTLTIGSPDSRMRLDRGGEPYLPRFSPSPSGNQFGTRHCAEVGCETQPLGIIKSVIEIVKLGNLTRSSRVLRRCGLAAAGRLLLVALVLPAASLLQSCSASLPDAWVHLSPTRTRDGHLVLEAGLDDRVSGRFLVDTGSTANFITAEMVRRLGLAVGSRTWREGEVSSGVVLGSIGLGRARFTNVSFFILEKEELTRAGLEQVDGLLGMNIFRSTAALLHVSKNRLSLWPSGRLAPVDVRRSGFDPRSRVQLAAADQGSGLTLIPARLDAQLTRSLLLDTGSEHTLIPAAWAQELELRPYATVQYFTLGAHKRLRLAVAKSVCVGDACLESPILAYMDVPSGDQQALLGMDLLSSLPLLIDFPQGVLYPKRLSSAPHQSRATTRSP